MTMMVMQLFSCYQLCSPTLTNSFLLEWINLPTTWNSPLSSLQAPELLQNTFIRALKMPVFLSAWHRWAVSRNFGTEYTYIYLLTYLEKAVFLQYFLSVSVCIWASKIWWTLCRCTCSSQSRASLETLKSTLLPNALKHSTLSCCQC